MSCSARVRSANVAEPETPRPVLRPAGNNAPSINTQKPTLKPIKKTAEKPQLGSETMDKKVFATPEQKLGTVRTMLRQQEMKKGPNSAMNGSWSSDASSSDSFHSRASSRRFAGKRIGGVSIRKNQGSPKAESGDFMGKGNEDSGVVESIEGKKRCSWVTPNTDPSYVAFHDEEWGVPVHDDKKLFELLCLSGALAELTWPAILSKRHIFREVFLNFDPVAISRLNEKKIVAQGSTASSLLSESKLRGIIENARQICKIIEEFGSFDNYIWNFMNNKQQVSQFRYPRQVPVRTSKADFISKDLVRRGFRSVGPTVVYSFMQVSGLTNDHLISCFRFHECISKTIEKGSSVNAATNELRRQENGSVLEVLVPEAVDNKLTLLCP